MSYAQGSLIDAADYNTLANGTSSDAGYNTAANWVRQSAITITAAGSTTSITGNGGGSNVYFYLPITVLPNTNYNVSILFGAFNAGATFVINTVTNSMSGALATLTLPTSPSFSTSNATFNSGANTTVYLQSFQVSASTTNINSFSIETTNIASAIGVGFGTLGYGQPVTAIAPVSAGATVTATQWSGVLTALNSALGHQSGAGALLSGNYTAGQTITHFANVATAVGTITNNRALYSAQGSTLTGANRNATINRSDGFTLTYFTQVNFANEDAARYFFNAGGQLNYRLSVLNADANGAENSFARLVNGLGGIGLRNTTNTGRTGSGITLNINNTAHGYRSGGNNEIHTIVEVTDTTSGYTTSTARIQVANNGQLRVRGGNGLGMIFYAQFTRSDKTWDDALNLTLVTACDVVFPSSTYLTTNSWGTPTITQF
jgi:hypothetical protein